MRPDLEKKWILSEIIEHGGIVQILQSNQRAAIFLTQTNRVAGVNWCARGSATRAAGSAHREPCRTHGTASRHRRGGWRDFACRSQDAAGLRSYCHTARGTLSMKPSPTGFPSCSPFDDRAADEAIIKRRFARAACRDGPHRGRKARQRAGRPARSMMLSCSGRTSPVTINALDAVPVMRTMLQPAARAGR